TGTPRVIRLRAMGAEVARRVRAAIEDHGPIGVDEYMEIALYGPGGVFGGARGVRAAIEDHGPIGFDEYMEIALYGPGGFFEAPPVGPHGHFVTSPHVHPFVFAHCVRDALLDAWFGLGEIEPFPIVELGAGDGPR